MTVPKRTGKKPLGLLLFFHPDGADHKYERYARKLQAVADQHQVVVASMQEPDEDCWWAPRCLDNSRFVADFVDTLHRRYRLDPKRVYFTGESGGAAFAGGLIAHLGFKYGGGIIAVAGTDIPRLNGGDPDHEIDPPALPMPHAVGFGQRGNIRMHTVIGSKDYLLKPTRQAMDFYNRLGLQSADLEIVRGYDHCDFDAVEEIDIALQNWG